MLFRRITQPPEQPVAPEPPRCPGQQTADAVPHSGVPPGYRDVPPTGWDPQAPVDLAEAEEFLRLCYAEVPGLGDVADRLQQVRAEVAATGTYVHTAAELVHGARLAWRNSSKCVGRLYWRSLLVRDCRHAGGAGEVYRELLEHLRAANGGPGSPAARPVMSVFPPAAPGRQYPRIWNDQLIRYAGYRSGERVVGDPQYLEFTQAMTALGWRGAGGLFDVLPLAIEAPGEGVQLFELPGDVVLEVPLTHPDGDWFADLGLRWHAVPAISHMRLSIGGINYPLAPFSGWYLVTEVGTRNLADPERYDMAPVVAERLGLDTSGAASLWRDRAILEINRAVLHSFQRAGVRISDPHTEADRFLSHVERERRHGRVTPADWTWIVGAVGTGTSAFHHYYVEADQRPNLYLDPAARRLARTGRPEGGNGSHPPTNGVEVGRMRPALAGCPQRDLVDQAGE